MGFYCCTGTTSTIIQPNGGKKTLLLLTGVVTSEGQSGQLVVDDIGYEVGVSCLGKTDYVVFQSNSHGEWRVMKSDRHEVERWCFGEQEESPQVKT